MADSRIKDVLDDILALVAGGGGIDARIDALEALVYPDAYNQLTLGQSTIPRAMTTTTSSVTLTSQLLSLTYFTATKSFTTSQVVLLNGTAAGATPTLVRAGLYSIAANGDGTLIASFANDTTLFAVANTAASKSWTTPVALTAGSRYAFGALCVTGATAPALSGTNFAGGTTAFAGRLGVAPRMYGTIAGSADLPASFAAASLGTAAAVRAYAEILP